VLLVLRIAFYLVGAATVVWLMGVVLRSKRRLDRRVSEFRKEMEDDSSPKPDPWTELAALYEEREREERARKG
jgi:hypothetical protein